MTTTTSFVPTPYWFIHHEVIFEFTREPVENRVRYIKRYKPDREHAVRLTALRPVLEPDKIPARVTDGYVAYEKAYTVLTSYVADLDRPVDLVAFDSRAEARAASSHSQAARVACERAFETHDLNSEILSRARVEFWGALAENMPALVAQYLGEYPENAGVFNHEAGNLLLPPRTFTS